MYDAQIPVLDELDTLILMHRDVHFGKSFTAMVEYYESDGVGVLEQIPVDRIKKLQAAGDQAEALLTDQALEKIAKGKERYQALQTLYDKPEENNLLIPDLILSEEEVPEKEIEALVAQGEKSFSPLLALLNHIDFYDPLSPGYGRAPQLAAIALSRIGNPKAIPHLFNALCYDDFFAQDTFIQALAKFGSSARDFLIERLGNKPYGKDNDMAAAALSSLPEEEVIAKAALKQLTDPEMRKESFLSYLVILCSALKSPEDQELFKKIRKEKLPAFIQQEMDITIKNFLH
ncbi:MAG: HEAT repeat domain-containing protein [Simkaniaceae bacterium]|nr:HEAT repeat domain-containing protein [Simkaniaceae bacterium]